MLYNALKASQKDIVLITLWNGVDSDGPGEIEYRVAIAKSRGSRFIHIKTKSLI